MSAVAAKSIIAKSIVLDYVEGKFVVDGEPLPYAVAPRFTVSEVCKGLSSVTVELFVRGDVEIVGEPDTTTVSTYDRVVTQTIGSDPIPAEEFDKWWNEQA